MLKTGIYGADTPAAGELIRLLVNHPDVDITQLYAPTLKGENVSTRHHGLIGERPLKFTDRFDAGTLDVLFLCRADNTTARILSTEKELQQRGEELSEGRKRPLRIIDLTGLHIGDYEESGLEYGLSEINRKPLVRGARRSVVPTPQASIALVSLYPIATHLLLNGDLHIRFTLPAGASDEWDTMAACHDITRQLSKIQSSYGGNVEGSVEKGDQSRSLRMLTEIPCSLRLEDVTSLYDSIYDDHNFTWIIHTTPDTKEVEGTQKCIISLTKPDSSTLRIESVADCRMRGGAGEAVHQMNLLCGLHERTGLRVKSSAF